MFSEDRTAFKGGFILLALMFATYLIESFFYSAPLALTNVLIPEFGMSYAEAGLVMSVYMAPYALMQAPGVSLSDRWSPSGSDGVILPSKPARDSHKVLFGLALRPYRQGNIP
jgi:MFS family permease